MPFLLIRRTGSPNLFTEISFSREHRIQSFGLRSSVNSYSIENRYTLLGAIDTKTTKTCCVEQCARMAEDQIFVIRDVSAKCTRRIIRLYHITARVFGLLLMYCEIVLMWQLEQFAQIFEIIWEWNTIQMYNFIDICLLFCNFVCRWTFIIVSYRINYSRVQLFYMENW